MAKSEIRAQEIKAAIIAGVDDCYDIAALEGLLTITELFRKGTSPTESKNLTYRDWGIIKLVRNLRFLSEKDVWFLNEYIDRLKELQTKALEIADMCGGTATRIIEA